MNTFGISPQSFQLITDAFSQYPQIESVVLFGSRAKGNYKNGSDIDLAIKGIECTNQFTENIKAMLNEELNIPYHVDVVNYETLSHLDLKAHIDRVGKEFHINHKL